MSANDEHDKTRVQPRASTATPEDRTRFAPRDRLKQQEPADDATRLAPRAPAAQAADDRTRIASRPVPPPDLSSDVTRITARPVSTGSAAAAPAGDVSGQNESMLKNRFVFEEVIGTGGMGIVYKAKDMLKVEAQDRDPYVAIKVLSEEFKSHPEAFIALQRESRKTQRIAHPNIVNVHDFDRDGDTVFMTMEYMEGKPLDKLISQYRSTGLPPEDAIRVLEGISAALVYAHQQNIIHSDFKPGNIFVTNNGTAKVFDFGIARAVAKAEHREESLEDKTVFDAGNLGALTPAYASLEMLEGRTPDVRDDVYALGCIAYEMFTGEHPYNRVHADEAQRQNLKPRRISGLTGNQWKAIEGALALKRQDRIASVEEFLRKFNQKKSHTLALLAGFGLVLVAAGAGVYSYWPQLTEGFAEDEVRSEIEQQLRIELRMQAVTELLASPSFTEEWEAQLWADIQVLREVVASTDPWMTATEAQIYRLYINHITSAIDDLALDLADRLLSHAERYTGDPTELADLQTALAAARKEQERLAQEKQRQERAAQAARQRQAEVAREEEQRRTEFEQALVNVEKQLECRNHIDMEDFTIALNKLKSLSSAQYGEQEPRIMRLMGQCISRIGEYFPERAEAAKERALELFNNHRLIAAVKIAPKDSCHSALAGLGSSGMRATCRDILKDNSRGPILVVAPATDAIPLFAIGKYEVTQGEYNAYCEQSSACTANTGDLHLPITDISLQNARSYLRWLSEQTGRTYRLPTLSEWRYAASATDAAIDPNRNCRLRSRGISRGNSLLRASVGKQNSWGLVNHVGNAREWAVAGGGDLMAVGGAFDSPMEECDIASSIAHNGSADNLTGFRVLREIGR